MADKRCAIIVHTAIPVNPKTMSAMCRRAIRDGVGEKDITVTIAGYKHEIHGAVYIKGRSIELQVCGERMEGK